MGGLATCHANFIQVFFICSLNIAVSKLCQDGWNYISLTIFLLLDRWIARKALVSPGGLGQRDENGDVVGGEKARLPPQGSLQPVFVEFF